MSMNVRLALGLGFVVAAGGTGCTRAVTEAQMQDRNQVAQIAAKEVKTDQKNGAHVKRIAVLGIATPNQVHESHGGFGFGGHVGNVINVVNTVNSINDMVKAIACRALDASFDEFSKSLTTAGFELVVPDEKLQQDKYRPLTTASMPQMCYAARAPVRLSLGQVFKWKETFAVLQQLMDELGVDGIVMGQLGADDLKTGDQSLTLYVKGPDGIARVGWAGRVKHGNLQFDVAQPGKTDDAKLANAARVYARSFELLTTKMATEAK